QQEQEGEAVPQGAAGTPGELHPATIAAARVEPGRPFLSGHGSCLHCLSLLVEHESAVAAVHADRVAFAEIAFEHPQRERIEDAALNRPLERTRAVDRIIALMYEELPGGIGQSDANLALLEAARQAADLNIDDPF